MSIITHSDTFHCDEVMACAMLKFLYPDRDIIRTRDDNVLKSKSEDSYMVDVGKLYDHEKKLYDHHQESFSIRFFSNEKKSEKYTVCMSSCGLIWLHYGHAIINKIVEDLKTSTEGNIDIDKEYIFDKFYKIFVYPIDCNDNGKSNDYRDSVYIPIELSNIVGSFNGSPSDHQSQMVNFMNAMQMCQSIFLNRLTRMIHASLNYTKYLDSFLVSWALSQLSNKNYIMIDHEQMPIHSYLAKFDPDQTIKFIIVCRNHDNWRLWTVNKKNDRMDRFAILLPLISESTARDLPCGKDIIFIHKACFTGACKTRDTAVSVIEHSLPQPSKLGKVMNYIRYLLDY